MTILPMGKKHTPSKLTKATKKAWKFYSEWRKTGSKCPAFGGEIIYVSRLGWDHLLSSRKHRTKVEKILRLNALPLAQKILEISTTFQEYRRDRGITFWAFVATIEGKQIKVVVSSKNKKKYFLSVIVLK